MLQKHKLGKLQLFGTNCCLFCPWCVVKIKRLIVASCNMGTKEVCMCIHFQRNRLSFIIKAHDWGEIWSWINSLTLSSAILTALEQASCHSCTESSTSVEILLNDFWEREACPLMVELQHSLWVYSDLGHLWRWLKSEQTGVAKSCSSLLWNQSKDPTYASDHCTSSHYWETIGVGCNCLRKMWSQKAHWKTYLETMKSTGILSTSKIWLKRIDSRTSVLSSFFFYSWVPLNLNLNSVQFRKWTRTEFNSKGCIESG